MPSKYIKTGKRWHKTTILTIHNRIGLIRLTLGIYAIVDASDAERINAFRWHARRYRTNTYAVRTSPRSRGREYIGMHHEVLNVIGKQCDHKNHIGLDNRRSNLRLADDSQNACNVIRIDRKTGFRGVHRCPSISERWYAEVQWKRRRYYLGSFASGIEAAKAYNDGALRLQGEFAVLNKLETA